MANDTTSGITVRLDEVADLRRVEQAAYDAGPDQTVEQPLAAAAPAAIDTPGTAPATKRRRWWQR